MSSMRETTVLSCSSVPCNSTPKQGPGRSRIISPAPTVPPSLTASVNPAPIKNDGHPSRDDGNAQCDGGRHFTDGAGPLDLMGADPSVQ